MLFLRRCGINTVDPGLPAPWPPWAPDAAPPGEGLRKPAGPPSARLPGDEDDATPSENHFGVEDGKEYRKLARNKDR